MRHGEIKDPTLRKVKNRGFEPVRYRTDIGFRNGWIYKRGNKLTHLYLIGLGHRRVPHSEERYMKFFHSN